MQEKIDNTCNNSTKQLSFVRASPRPQTSLLHECTLRIMSVAPALQFRVRKVQIDYCDHHLLIMYQHIIQIYMLWVKSQILLVKVAIPDYHHLTASENLWPCCHCDHIEIYGGEEAAPCCNWKYFRLRFITSYWSLVNQLCTYTLANIQSDFIWFFLLYKP